MATTIKLKNSVTTTNAPSSLAQGEVAINVTDKKVWVGNAATTPVQLLGTGSDGSFTNLTVSGTTALNGGATLGDASGDALTINSSAVSIPNGLNFDSNTFVIDATNNYVGIGTSSPATIVHAQKSSGNTYYRAQNNLANVDFGVDGAGTGILWNNSNYPLAFGTNNSERMRIDSSGNVGIGTSSPDSKLHVQRSNDGVIGTFRGTSSAQLLLSIASGNLVYDSSNGNATHVWQSNTTERMRIDSSGNLLVGTTSRVNNERLSVKQTGSGAWPIIMLGEDRGAVFRITASSGYAAYFERNNGSYTGDIFITSSGTTTFNTASDYRLKENIAPMTGALDKVAALKPVTYTWKSNGEASQGFIAHELAEVVPDCVTGEKDAVDAEGNPVYQGIDTSFLVATLTASIQELKAIVDAQAERIAVLESK